MIRVGADDAEGLSRLHAQAFSERPWSAAEFKRLLAGPAIAFLSPGEGFVLVWALGDDAEILTLAVAPTARRRGVGKALVEAAVIDAARNGAKALFLEVAEGNVAARALYAAAGFHQTGRRRRYYASGEDALVLTRALVP
jgi:ribosomal-protein-alanine N-acetyltransferase